jgi:penicillin-binding protein 1A
MGVLDWPYRRSRKKRGIDWLKIDAFIDSKLWGAWQSLNERWDWITAVFARFRLSGVKRLLTEVFAEALTLTAGGLAGLYALAIPALTEFDADRITTGQLSVKFLDRNGNEIGQRGILHDDAVPLEEIPDHLIKATLATEDRRFYEHFGVDVFGTMRALIENARANEVVQGGSTLTQQLAKNLFLSSERSLERKVKELFLALLLESRFSKRQILKMYLDRAYLGGGAFGVEAASQYYFGKSVREIGLAESAMLAGLFKAPSKFAPHVNLALSRARTNDVLTNLVDAGFMTEGQVRAARLNPARIIDPRRTDTPDWFLDWAFEEVQRLTDGRGQHTLIARTTVDVELQKAAEQALRATLLPTGERGDNPFSGVLVAMEPDGAVRAMVGGLDYGESQFNRAVHARRQPGSSFKLYVYATAFENGYNPHSPVRDQHVTCGNWSPRNYHGGGGSGRSMPAIDAFKVSLNTPAVDLSLKVGRDKVLEMTRRLGVEGVRKTCSMALGDSGIAPLQHTSAYATFANGGKLTKPYAALELVNSRGESIYQRERDEPPAPQVVRRRVVEQMNQMMQAVVTQGTGKAAALDFTTVAGKTGTSSSYRDAWFVGFTGALVAGVWVGHDDFRPMSYHGQGVTGGSLPTQAWHAFMAVAHGTRAIPPIPGLPPHPQQLAQGFAEPARDASAHPEAQAAGAPGRGLLSDETRQYLRRLSETLRRAAATAPGPVTDGAPQADLPAREGSVGISYDRRAEAKGDFPLPKP